MTVSLVGKMKGITLIALLFFVERCASLHVAPSIESCPNDSVQAGDICKCDHKRCSKPPCLYRLEIASNGTDVPGSCCTVYSCDGCPDESRIGGRCPCAPDAVLDGGGVCKCVDPHKRLLNDEECVCDPDLCELPQICDEHHVAVAERSGCCTKTKCIKCPDDSFPSNNRDDAVEDKCLCYPCKSHCEPNETAVVIQRGSGFPGNCCDMYQCKSNRCVVDNATYGEGELWETEDGQRCRCRGGISFCDVNEERSCYKEGTAYKHNESWMADSCTNCTCFNGETKCIAHTCEVSEGYLKKPECQPLDCAKSCPNGYRLNKRGCKICKCNPPFKYDDVLHKYNITKNELEQILERHFLRTASTDPPSTAFPPTANISEINTTVCEKDTWLVHVILWPLVGITTLIAGIILYFMIRKCRSHGSYNTNPATSTFYERVKLQTDTLFNNNYINKNVKGSV